MNVRGLGECKKRRQIFKYIHDQKIDIAMLQETHGCKRKHNIWSAEYGGKIIFADDSTRAKGVVILFNKKLEIDVNKMEIVKDNGRYLMINLLIAGKKFCLINVYAPNEDPQFFLELFSKIENLNAEHIVLMGDLNVYLNPKEDRKGGVSNKQTKAAEIINNFLQETDWLDVWRNLHPDQFSFTWKRNKPLIMSRLDYILAPINTALAINTCQIMPTFLSDHCPMYCEITLDDAVKGPGLWKFNV